MHVCPPISEIQILCSMAKLLNSIVIQRKKRYNKGMRTTRTCLSLLLLSCILLSACKKEEPTLEALPSFGSAKSSLFTARALTDQVLSITRPSSTLGIYSGLFIAQGIFLHTESALAGLETQKMIIAGQSGPISDETFALLQEIGNILQTDVNDILNRSTDRRHTLDFYVESLRSSITLVERKIAELEEQLEQLKDARKSQRNEERDIERAIKQAMKERDYASAAPLEKKLAKASSNRAETETKEDQAKDILKRFEDILEIADERLIAIQRNRQVLLSGLHVVNVPGIEDLGILEKETKWGSGGSEIFNLEL